MSSPTPSILWHSAFFMVQLSQPYLITGKTIALTTWAFVGRVILELMTLGNVGTFPPSLLSSPQLSIPVLEACHMACVFRRLYSQLLPSGMSILSDKEMKPDKLLNSFNLG